MMQHHTARAWTTLAAIAAALLLTIPTVGARPLDDLIERPFGNRADSGCTPDLTACGTAVSTSDDCTSFGYVVAAGVSTSDETEWWLVYHGWSHWGPDHQNHTGQGREFVAKAHYRAGIGMPYDYHATLYADGEPIAHVSNSWKCA